MVYADALALDRTFVSDKISVLDRLKTAFGEVKTAVRDYLTIEQRPEELSKNEVLEAFSSGFEYSGLEQKLTTSLRRVKPTNWGKKVKGYEEAYQNFLEMNDGAMFSDGNTIYQITSSGITPTGYSSFDDVPSTRTPNGPRIFSIAMLLTLFGVFLGGCIPKPNTQQPTFQSPTDTDTPPTACATPTGTSTSTATSTVAPESVLNYYCMQRGDLGDPGIIPRSAALPDFDESTGYKMTLPLGGFLGCRYELSNLPIGEYTLQVFGQGDTPLFTKPLISQGNIFYADLLESILIKPDVQSCSLRLAIVDASGLEIRTDMLNIFNPFYATATPTATQTIYDPTATRTKSPTQIIPSNTPVPPTQVIPSNTPKPPATNTPVPPPTNTPVPPATNTPVPPTQEPTLPPEPTTDPHG